jgi:uncharacterized SAM-binding protein YcdF (DUF218 family)
VLVAGAMNRRATLIVAGCALVTVLTILAMRGAAAWLIVENPLEHARAVVVLGGQTPFRAMEAARLYRDGWAPEVWLTRGYISDEDRALSKLGIVRPAEYTYSVSVLKRMGVPEPVIRVLPGETLNTAEEMCAIDRELASIHGGSAIIVTSKYHARRVMVLWSLLAGPRPRAVVRYTPDDPFDPAGWWHTTGEARIVSREWFGLFNAWAGFPVRAGVE